MPECCQPQGLDSAANLGSRNPADRCGTTVDAVPNQCRTVSSFGRMATATEMASTAPFLTSMEAGLFNGAWIPVDGRQIV